MASPLPGLGALLLRIFPWEKVTGETGGTIWSERQPGEPVGEVSVVTPSARIALLATIVPSVTYEPRQRRRTRREEATTEVSDLCGGAERRQTACV